MLPWPRSLFTWMLLASGGLHGVIVWSSQAEIVPPRLLSPQIGKTSVLLLAGDGFAPPEPIETAPAPEPEKTEAKAEVLPAPQAPAPVSEILPLPVLTSVHATETLPMPTVAAPRAELFPAPKMLPPVLAEVLPLPKKEPEKAKKSEHKPRTLLAEVLPLPKETAIAAERLPIPQPQEVTGKGNQPASAASAPSQGVVDEMPRQVYGNAPPPYPAGALAARHQGRVMLWVRINAAGRVDSIRLHQTSGVPSLDDSALNTVQTWVFIPARRGSTAIAYEVLVPVDFYLR